MGSGAKPYSAPLAARFCHWQLGLSTPIPWCHTRTRECGASALGRADTCHSNPPAASRAGPLGALALAGLAGARSWRHMVDHAAGGIGRAGTAPTSTLAGLAPPPGRAASAPWPAGTVVPSRPDLEARSRGHHAQENAHKQRHVPSPVGPARLAQVQPGAPFKRALNRAPRNPGGTCKPPARGSPNEGPLAGPGRPAAPAAPREPCPAPRIAAQQPGGRQAPAGGAVTAPHDASGGGSRGESEASCRRARDGSVPALPSMCLRVPCRARPPRLASPTRVMTGWRAPRPG